MVINISREDRELAKTGSFRDEELAKKNQFNEDSDVQGLDQDVLYKVNDHSEVRLYSVNSIKEMYYEMWLDDASPFTLEDILGNKDKLPKKLATGTMEFYTTNPSFGFNELTYVCRYAVDEDENLRFINAALKNEHEEFLSEYFMHSYSNTTWDVTGTIITFPARLIKSDYKHLGVGGMLLAARTAGLGLGNIPIISSNPKTSGVSFIEYEYVNNSVLIKPINIEQVGNYQGAAEVASDIPRR